MDETLLDQQLQRERQCNTPVPRPDLQKVQFKNKAGACAHGKLTHTKLSTRVSFILSFISCLELALRILEYLKNLLDSCGMLRVHA